MRVFPVLFALLISGTSMAEEPMEAMLRHVPAEAERDIYVVDIAASARQFAGIQSADQQLKGLLPFGTLPIPRGLFVDPQTAVPDGYRDALGFSIAEIAQAAGWLELPPEAPVVIHLPDLEQRLHAIGSALSARNYDVTTRDSITIWHAFDDFKIGAPPGADPFLGMLGTSARLAVQGDTLTFAKTWPQMERLLAGGSSLADQPDAAALMRLAYALADRGDLVGMIYLGQQRPILEPERFLGSAALPEAILALKARVGESRRVGLPTFAQHALALWQDETKFSGAILIPYKDKETAEAARSVFQEKFATSSSLVNDRPLAELLPSDYQIAIVENDTSVGVKDGPNWTLVASFFEQIDVHGDVYFHSFKNTPIDTLEQLYKRRELRFLTGSAVD